MVWLLMKLYLDDCRDTPEGYERVYTVEEAKQRLLKRDITYLSVDNDLGDLDPKTEGFNLLDWLEEQVYVDSTFPIPIISIHSSNEGRKILMKLVVEKLEKIRQQQIGGS